MKNLSSPVARLLREINVPARADLFCSKFSSVVRYNYSTIIQPYRSFDPLSSTGEIDVHTRVLFWTKFNSKELLFEAFFDVTRIFGVEPKSESILLIFAIITRLISASMLMGALV